MPVLEIRRHSIRKTDGGSQLSQDGVRLARKIGEGRGPFARVVTSVAPRTRETAIAMGFAVDHELVTLAGYEVHAELQDFAWENKRAPFADVAELVVRGNDYARYAHATAALWRDMLTPLKENEEALFIGHSGELEAGLVACFPGSQFVAWGGVFRPLEGARIHFTGEPKHFSEVEILRIESFDA